MSELALAGFYAVLDRDDVALAHALLASGAKILQVRLKSRERRVGAGEILRVARMARPICDEHGAKLVVNDRFDVALLAKADGVHLGQTDLPIDRVRAIAGDRLFVGVSTHDANQVRAALKHHPDYIAYGPVFETATKENPDPVQGLEALARAVEIAGSTPIVAIGGISGDRAPEVYATGAAAICAIGAVNRALDVGLAARSFRRVSPRENIG
ncbi:MAG: thiamine phosphate synthase [Kofleriaceae bacterium]